MWFQQSQGYHNRPQVDKVDRKLTDRLVAEVGIKNFIEYVENEFYSSAMEHEYQGFIYGFRIAVSLLQDGTVQGAAVGKAVDDKSRQSRIILLEQ